MPEAKKWQGNRILGVKVDMSEFEYKDKARERARRVAMKEAETATPYVPSEEVLKKRKDREAWSRKHGQHDIKEQRREKKRRKREAERLEKMTLAEKEEEKKLQVMIEEVKRKRKETEETEFQGFAD
jgi:ATP-dependent RNA helicase DDX55/SPB4